MMTSKRVSQESLILQNSLFPPNATHDSKIAVFRRIPRASLLSLMFTTKEFKKIIESSADINYRWIRDFSNENFKMWMWYMEDITNAAKIYYDNVTWYTEDMVGDYDTGTWSAVSHGIVEIINNGTAEVAMEWMPYLVAEARKRQVKEGKKKIKIILLAEFVAALLLKIYEENWKCGGRCHGCTDIKMSFNAYMKPKEKKYMCGEWLKIINFCMDNNCFVPEEDDQADGILVKMGTLLIEVPRIVKYRKYNCVRKAFVNLKK